MLFPGKSMCEPNQSKVVIEENHNKHILNNSHHNKVYQYHIDGDIIPSGTSEKRCDYIVEVEISAKKLAFIIELKGTDIKEAIQQIDATISRLSQLQSFILYPRIIVNRVNTHKIQDTKIIGFRKKYPNAVIRVKEYTDNI